MLVLIDNYDSFTYNLVQYFGDLGQEPRVIRNDAMAAADVMAKNPEAVIISPGPCDPDNAGICIDLIQQAAHKNVPLLGICLGHQAIGQAFGGRVIRAPEPVHGKTDRIQHKQSGLYEGIPLPQTATRYHSLIVERETLPAELAIISELKDGMIMGLAHKEKPIFGVQYHPESYATDDGHTILNNFLKIALQ